MGGFLGLGHSSAKTDRGNQLAGINAEWNIYNRGMPLADTEATAGQQTTNKAITGIDEAKTYWQKLLSGDRTTVMGAASPAISAIQDEQSARRNQQAEMGTGRTGGATAENEQAQTNELAQINKIIAGVQPEAAKGATATATAEGNIGLTQMGQALRAMGLSQATADEIVESSIKSRPISMQANAEVRQMWSNFLGGLGF